MPINPLIKIVNKYPSITKFFTGFALFAIFSRLIFSYHITYKTLKLVLKRVHNPNLGNRDIKLVKKYFKAADPEERDAEALSATEIVRHIHRHTKQKLSAKSLGRKLKKAFPRTKSRKYIVKELPQDD